MALQVECEDITCYMPLYNRVRRMFDLDTCFADINQRFAHDCLLSRGMQDGHVPRLPVAFNPFEFTVRAVLGQQISVKAATTLAFRIARKAGSHTDRSFPCGLDLFFPTPQELMEIDLEDLGITRTRQNTIRTVTAGVLNGQFSLAANQSFAEFYKAFTALKGIGDWTANYVAMRGLGHMDCFPANDLGIIRALAVDGKAQTLKDMQAFSEKWRPYRTYAALCLWNADYGKGLE